MNINLAGFCAVSAELKQRCNGCVHLQASQLGFPEPGYIEVGSSNLEEDASIGFSFQTGRRDALLLLAKGSAEVRCCH